MLFRRVLSMILTPATQISQQLNAAFTTSNYLVSYGHCAMRQAFVLQLGADTDPARQHFTGVIEEVDTGRELRFKSTDELLAFLAQCSKQK